MSEEVVNVCQFNDLDLLEINSSFNSKGVFLILKRLNILQSSYLKKKSNQHINLLHHSKNTFNKYRSSRLAARLNRF